MFNDADEAAAAINRVVTGAEAALTDQEIETLGDVIAYIRSLEGDIDLLKDDINARLDDIEERLDQEIAEDFETSEPHPRQTQAADFDEGAEE